jgi:hypothetical protein
VKHKLTLYGLPIFLPLRSSRRACHSERSDVDHLRVFRHLPLIPEICIQDENNSAMA